MSRCFIIALLLIFLCSCSTSPIKKQRVKTSKDYKDYITLKEEPVRKTIPERIVGIFKKEKPEPDESTSKVIVDKKPVKLYPNKQVNTPARRMRQTNTNQVSQAPGELMPLQPQSDKDVVKPRSSLTAYFIYMQAVIIAILSIYTYIKIRSFKTRKQQPPRKLNL